MDKYVKLSDLMEYPIRLDHYDKEHGNEHFVIGVESVLEYADYLATTDVQKKKYGRWIQEYGFKEIHYSSDDIERYKISHGCSCSICSTWNATKTNYCPNCGADMREEERPLNWIPRDNWELGCEYECPYCGADIDVPHGGIMPHKCWKCEKEIGVN